MATPHKTRWFATAGVILLLVALRLFAQVPMGPATQYQIYFDGPITQIDASTYELPAGASAVRVTWNGLVVADCAKHPDSCDYSLQGTSVLLYRPAEEGDILQFDYVVVR